MLKVMRMHYEESNDDIFDQRALVVHRDRRPDSVWDFVRFTTVESLDKIFLNHLFPIINLSRSFVDYLASHPLTYNKVKENIAIYFNRVLLNEHSPFPISPDNYRLSDGSKYRISYNKKEQIIEVRFEELYDES